MFVFGLSEPGRGSDATNPQVTATKDGNDWIIKGENVGQLMLNGQAM